MSEKQTKRRRRLLRLAMEHGVDVLSEAYQRFDGDTDATLQWVTKAMKEYATNPTVNIRDLLPGNPKARPREVKVEETPSP